MGGGNQGQDAGDRAARDFVLALLDVKTDHPPPCERQRQGPHPVHHRQLQEGELKPTISAGDSTKPHRRWNGWLTGLLLAAGAAAAITCLAFSCPRAALVVSVMVLILGLRLLLFLTIMASKR
jgi:hypothetical protein